MQGPELQRILYDASGNERRLIVSCSPYYDNFMLFGCPLRRTAASEDSNQIFLCSRTPKSNLCRMSARPPLVSADYPHAIHISDGAFLDRFSCGRQEVLGQPLHFFSSINSESFDGVLTPPCDAWSALLAIALDGRIARSRRNTSDDVGIQICGNAADEVTNSPRYQRLSLSSFQPSS